VWQHVASVKALGYKVTLKLEVGFLLDFYSDYSRISHRVTSNSVLTLDLDPSLVSDFRL